MQIEAGSIERPRRDFYELRDELIDAGKTFDAETLRQIPYHQLAFTCIGSAGAAACPPELVCAEKVARREQFLSLTEDEFKASETFLQIEGMYDDVAYAINARSAPLWSELKNRQQAWAKLICVHSHLDDVHLRVNEAILLLREAGQTTLPPEPVTKWMRKLRGLLTVYPGRITDQLFRDSIAEIAENLLDFLPDEERKVMDREEIQDFACTSDCFRIMAN